VIEGQIALGYGSTKNLSPQELVDCSTDNNGWCVGTHPMSGLKLPNTSGLPLSDGRE
jgi:prephenate dehydrogenase